MNKNKKQQWGWTLLNYEESAHGPFSSKEKAIKDANKYIADESNKIIDPEEKILVGTIQWADPCEYLPSFDDMLGLINAQARDNEYQFFDDIVFDLNSGKNEEMAYKDEEKATRELQKLLSKWAEKWIASMAWILVNTEEVIVKK